MDATQMAFPDNSFDAVVAPYVLTVLPDPLASLDELLRVTKPRGEIILVNHIGAAKGPMALIEAGLGKMSKSLGWRPEFPWPLLGDWIDARPCRLLERHLLPPLKLFTFVRVVKL
jgi:phosphatidylethanolamine/phosphatidyl-N-methylethanolamine N-methyltransferase